MEKSRVRWIFALVIIAFFTELMFALKFTEPFPAIIYPSFSDIPSYNSTIQKPRIIVFFNDLDSLEVNKEDFFDYLPNVYNNVILKENFNDRNSFLASLKEVRTLNATVGTKRINLNLTEKGDETHILEGKTWIANSLKNNLGRDDFERLEVQWYNYKLTENEQEPLEQGELAERFVVNFKR